MLFFIRIVSILHLLLHLLVHCHKVNHKVKNYIQILIFKVVDGLANAIFIVDEESFFEVNISFDHMDDGDEDILLYLHEDK